jgi:hypothetical protein
MIVAGREGGRAFFPFVLESAFADGVGGGGCLTLVGQSCLLDLGVDLPAGGGPGGVEAVAKLDEHLPESCHLGSEGGDRVGHEAVWVRVERGGRRHVVGWGRW